MSIRYIALFIVVALVVGMICSVALAAEEDNSPVTLDLKDADVRSAIESLFRGRNRNFSISQDVAGSIPSLSITGVPFDQALKSLLKSAGLVYRVENSVYMINKKPDTSATATLDAAALTAGDSATIDETTTVESIIDKVPLNNTGASQILAIMQGSNNNSNNSYGGGYGGMMGGMGMMGGGYGGSSYGGSSYGGSSYGGSNYGSRNYGGSSYGGGYGGSSYGNRSYGGSSYGGSSYGGGYRGW